jgi:ABC-type sugar transport system permease subunit
MNFPFHAAFHTSNIPSHTQAFTSTYNHSLFNIWLVLLTALFFFTVLSWYNFVLSLYYYLTHNTSYLTSEGLNQCEKLEKLRKQTLGSLVFALIWSGIALFIYWLLSSLGWLNGDSTEQKYWESHPLLRDEARIMK